MFRLDSQNTVSHSEISQYLHKCTLLYTKCAKGLDSNVNHEEIS